MPADRFFFDGLLTDTIELADSEWQHLRVMRIRPGETVEVVNGRGSLATGALVRDRVLQLSDIKTTPRPPLQLILGIPMMRTQKLELIFEKCTELGADAFYLFTADGSEKSDLSNHQLERLRLVTISALKQSGRLFLPTIELLSFERLLHTDARILFGDFEGSSTPKLDQTTLFITGPEKGFSKKELEELKKKGQGICLNRNILRAETAPIAFTSIVGSTLQ